VRFWRTQRFIAKPVGVDTRRLSLQMIVPPAGLPAVRMDPAVLRLKRAIATPLLARHMTLVQVWSMAVT